MAHIINNKTGKTEYVPDNVNTTTNKSDVSVSEPDKVNTTYNPTSNNGFSGNSVFVRDGLNAVGLDNEKIGFDGKYVTYDGNAIINPTENVNGVTKTNTKGFIDGVNNAYKSSGKDDHIEDVTSYVAGSVKLPNLVEYNNGVVSVGGVPIDNVVIIDGNSYAPKSAIEAAVFKYKEQSGYSTKKDLADQYLAKTQKQADAYLDKINNYQSFKYDPDSDPAYQAYVNAYTKRAKEAYDNTLAINNARTGGYLNSASLTAGNQAYYGYMDVINDALPEFMENAYGRYKDEYDMLFNGLELYGTPTQRYEFQKSALDADTDALTNALQFDYQRNLDNRDYNYKKSVDDREYDYEKVINDREYWRELDNDAWFREHIYTPQSMLNMQEYENNKLLAPYILEIEKEKARSYKLDNDYKEKYPGASR